MTFIEVIMVGIGGFFGAIIRYLIASKLNECKKIPVGTFFVNIVGSFLIGVLFGLDLERIWKLFLGSGLLGALTTFSTFHKELIELWAKGKKKVAIGYVLLTYVGGIFAALLGYYFLK